MKRSRKVLSWIVGVIVALLVIAVIVIATFDWNRLRPFINDKVSQAIGRPFAIHGDLTVDWQRDRSGGWLASLVPWPQFTARKVTVGNPAWASQPQFAHLDAARFRLSPLPLLAHRIDVPSLQLVNPAVDLERDGKSRATWSFTLPAHDKPSAWKLELGRIGFDRGTIALDDAVSKIKLKVTVKPLQGPIPYSQIVAQQSADARAQAGKMVGDSVKKTMASASEDDDAKAVGKADRSTVYQFGWDAKGTYQGSTLSGHGKTGAVLALRSTTEPFPIQADAHIGDSHIALVGTLTDPMHLGSLDVRLWFSGSSMAKLYPLTGVTLPDTPPYATEGHLKATLGAGDSHFSYQDFHGRVGGSDLSGSLDYATAGARPKLSGAVNSKVLRFADLGPVVGAAPAGSKATPAASAQPANKLLPVAPFRTDRWRAMDADVKFTGARIVHGENLPIHSLGTHLTMNDGVLRLDPLAFGVASGTVAGSLQLDGRASPMQGAVDLKARHMKLKELFPGFAPMRTSLGEVNGDVDLKAHGNSVAALLGDADGELKLLMNDGAISKTLLETAGLNIGNVIIGKLFGDKTVEINCAATDMAAKNGLFDMRLFVFDTDDAVINVSGTVNMANEKVDLDVVPHTKGFRIFSLRSPLYVGGTLKQPAVGVKKGPLIARGAGAVALGVVAAPAAALLALVAPSHDKDGENTCRAVLQELRSSGKVIPATKPVPNRK